MRAATCFVVAWTYGDVLYQRCCRALLLSALAVRGHCSRSIEPTSVQTHLRPSSLWFPEAARRHAPAGRRRTAMAVLRQAQSREGARARRAANNNYHRLIKTLVGKLEKLHKVYDTKVYLIAERNGRVRECVSTDHTGRPWLRPDQKALVSCPPTASND